jgi:uncharacterized membrane protein YphA (DoxX/SURF4 family)
LLVLGGAAINVPRWAAAGALLLSVLYAVVVVIMHGVDVVQHPGVFASWSGVAEQLALLAAGVAACAYLTRANGLPLPADRLLRAAVVAMGICLVIFGLAHFFYLGFTAEMVPAWIPGGQRFWASFTGVAHIAAGIALLAGIQARPAAILLTVMFASFGVLIHLQLLLAQANHLSWVMNSINLALTGSAWTFAQLLAQTNTHRVPVAAGVANIKA